MKKLISAIALVAISYTAQAQEQPRIGCMDRAIRIQAEQIKQGFIKQGLNVYKDAMLNMTSKEEYQIAVQLTKGQIYQMVYIGSRQSSKITFDLYQGRNRIDHKVLNSPEESNQIVYSFIPEKSDLYLVVLTQKQKNRDICGSFTIMQQEVDNEEE
jgi:hypothetical protein